MTGWVTASRANVSLTRRLGKSAPRHGGDDGEIILLGQLRLQAGAEADVLVILVDVDELAKLAVLVVDPLSEAGVLGLQGVKRLGHGSAIHLHDRLPGGEAAQRPWDSDFDGHGCLLRIESEKSSYCTGDPEPAHRAATPSSPGVTQPVRAPAACAWSLVDKVRIRLLEYPDRGLDRAFVPFQVGQHLYGLETVPGDIRDQGLVALPAPRLRQLFEHPDGHPARRLGEDALGGGQ